MMMVVRHIGWPNQPPDCGSEVVECPAEHCRQEEGTYKQSTEAAMRASH